MLWLKQKPILLWIASVALSVSLTFGERYQLTYDAIIFDKKNDDAGIVSSLAGDHGDGTGGEKGSSSSSSSSSDDYFDAAMVKSIGEDFIAYWNNYKKYHIKTNDEAPPVAPADCDDEEDYTMISSNSSTPCNDASDHASSTRPTDTKIEVNCLTQEGSGNKKSVCIADFQEFDIDFSIHSIIYKIEDMDQQALLAEYLTDEQHNFTDYNALQGVSFDIIVNANSNAAPSIFARDCLIHALHVFERLHTVEKLSSPIWSIHERPTPLQLIQRQTDIARKVQGGQAIATPGEDAASMETMILSKSNASKRYHHTNLSHSLKQSTSIWTIDEAGNKPVQCLFINGQLRATTSEAGIAHAEALVHPALLAHPDPRRIAVISDMPLPFLKEILKHKSIKEVTLVGVDPNAIELAEYHMKELNDCYMDGKYNKCMDNERITVVNENVHSWLNATVDIAHMEDGGGQYDVILVLDASSHMNSQLEGEEEDFVDKLQYLMGSSDSLVVFNAGSTPRPDDDFRIPSSRDRFLENILLEDHGFGTAALYDEPRSAPLDSTFVILFSSINDSYSYFSESYFRYVRSPPTAIDLDIMDRFHKQEFVPARNYDGATHANYLVPSRAWENWYCESELGRNQTACKNFMKDFYNPVIHQGEAEVRRDPVKGRGLYAVNDIPKGAYINADDSHMNLHIHRYQMEALQSFVEEYPDADMYNQLLQFFHAYGFENEPNGQSGWTVSVANVNTFINHACSEEARNAEGILDVHIEDSLFSPILYRQKNLGVITIAARDIKAGEELQMDYSGFRSTMTPEYANLLKSFCETGEGLVDVNGEDEL